MSHEPQNTVSTLRGQLPFAPSLGCRAAALRLARNWHVGRVGVTCWRLRPWSRRRRPLDAELGRVLASRWRWTSIRRWRRSTGERSRGARRANTGQLAYRPLIGVWAEPGRVPLRSYLKHPGLVGGSFTWFPIVVVAGRSAPPGRLAGRPAAARRAARVRSVGSAARTSPG